MIDLSEQSVIDEVVERLVHRYPDISAHTVATVVTGQHSRFEGSPLRDFVPLFVEKNSRAELARLRS